MAIDKMVDSAKLNREMLATANAIREKGKTEAAIPWEDEIGYEQAVLAIQSGGGLNFEVVGGTTEPENPEENTIWVNTDTEITSWLFSANEPTAPTPGMVWVRTKLSSIVEFNALEENGIQVYPLMAKQYVNGAWDTKSAYTYKNGVWIEWLRYLYNAGNQYAGITGGWSVDGYYASSGTRVIAGTVNANDLYVGKAGASTIAVLGTQLPIDLTNAKYIHFTLETTTNGNSSFFSVSKGKDLTTATASTDIKENYSGVKSIYVEELDGEFYVSAATSGNSVMNVTKVEVEWI